MNTAVVLPYAVPYGLSRILRYIPRGVAHAERFVLGKRVSSTWSSAGASCSPRREKTRQIFEHPAKNTHTKPNQTETTNTNAATIIQNKTLNSTAQVHTHKATYQIHKVHETHKRHTKHLTPDLCAVICRRFSSDLRRPSSLALVSACPIVSDSWVVNSESCVVHGEQRTSNAKQGPRTSYAASFRQWPQNPMDGVGGGEEVAPGIGRGESGRCCIVAPCGAHARTHPPTRLALKQVTFAVHETDWHAFIRSDRKPIHRFNDESPRYSLRKLISYR